MKETKPWSIGDRIEITAEGVRAHQQYHDDHVNVVAKVSTPHIRTVAEAAKETIFTFPEPGCKGSIVEVRRRWFGQPGHDYFVRWDDCCGQSWHLFKHLVLAE